MYQVIFKYHQKKKKMKKEKEKGNEKECFKFSRTTEFKRLEFGI